MAWREYAECSDCGRVVCINYTAGETRKVVLAAHKEGGACRPRDPVPKGPLSLPILRRCFKVDLEFIESVGAFDGDTVRTHLEDLLCHPLLAELEKLTKQGLRLIGLYGFVSEEDAPKLADIIRQIVERLPSVEEILARRGR